MRPDFRLVLNLWLQVAILRDWCKAGAVLLRVQVVVTYYQGSRICPVQLFQQLTERAALRLGARVGRSAADVEPTLIAYAYRVAVVSYAVCADHLLRPSPLDRSVTPDDVVVADAVFPASLLVPFIDLVPRGGLVGLHCRTMDDNQCNSSHDCTKIVLLIAVRMVITI